MRSCGQAFETPPAIHRAIFCVLRYSRGPASARSVDSPPAKQLMAPAYPGRFLDWLPNMCPDGGIGRRTVFRWRRSQGRGGSSPLLGTISFSCSFTTPATMARLFVRSAWAVCLTVMRLYEQHGHIQHQSAGIRPPAFLRERAP